MVQHSANNLFICIYCMGTSKHEKSNQCWLDVSPRSTMLAEHEASVEPKSCNIAGYLCHTHNGSIGRRIRCLPLAPNRMTRGTSFWISLLVPRTRPSYCPARGDIYFCGGRSPVHFTARSPMGHESILRKCAVLCEFLPQIQIAWIFKHM